MDRKERKKIKEQLGDTERFRQQLKKGEENHAFISANRESLLRQYPNKWIGVQDREVVAVSSTLEGVVRKMKKAGIDTSTAKLEFLDPHPRHQILSQKEKPRVARGFFFPQILDSPGETV